MIFKGASEYACTLANYINIAVAMMQSCHILLKQRVHDRDLQLAVEWTQRNRIRPIKVR
jgi:hypothetical protein